MRYIVGDNGYDAMTNLVKGKEKNTLNDRTVVTIPKGMLYSMSFRNVAFDREIAGVVMYPGLVEPGDAMAAYSEIICGWVAKVVLDHANHATKNGFPFVEYSEPTKKDEFSALRDEFQVKLYAVLVLSSFSSTPNFPFLN